MTTIASSGVRAITAALRPLFGIGFPGRKRAFRALASTERAARHWQGAGLRWTESKIHGLTMPCDLGIESGRISWLYRRWEEVDTQALLITILPPGGCFVDIGANVGMATLCAAQAVGPTGRVVAFEPNPRVHGLLEQAVARNRLAWVEAHNAAIGEEAGSLPLFVPDINHGQASLLPRPSDLAGRTVEVAVRTGAMLEGLAAIDAIKIDVEGYETHVLRAIRAALVVHRPVVLTEMIDRFLRRAGSSAAEMAAMLGELDYVGMVFTPRKVGMRRVTADLKPLGEADYADDINVLWVPRQRVAEFAAERIAIVAN